MKEKTGFGLWSWNEALANSSPGFALKPWVEGTGIIRRNSEGVASSRMGMRRPHVFELQPEEFEPWAGICQRFQRKGC